MASERRPAAGLMPFVDNPSLSAPPTAGALNVSEGRPAAGFGPFVDDPSLSPPTAGAAELLVSSAVMVEMI